MSIRRPGRWPAAAQGRGPVRAGRRRRPSGRAVSRAARRPAHALRSTGVDAPGVFLQGRAEPVVRRRLRASKKCTASPRASARVSRLSIRRFAGPQVDALVSDHTWVPVYRPPAYGFTSRTPVASKSAMCRVTTVIPCTIAVAAIGAQVRVETGGATLLREVICGASYLSGNDLHLTFGLGSATRVDNLQIRWHNGDVQRLDKVPIRQSITLLQD